MCSAKLCTQELTGLLWQAAQTALPARFSPKFLPALLRDQHHIFPLPSTSQGRKYFCSPTEGHAWYTVVTPQHLPGKHPSSRHHVSLELTSPYPLCLLGEGKAALPEPAAQDPHCLLTGQEIGWISSLPTHGAVISAAGCSTEAGGIQCCCMF